MAFILSVVYAITDEYHQTWVPGRTGKTTDTLIDGGGAAFGVLFAAKIIHCLPKKIKKIITQED